MENSSVSVNAANNKLLQSQYPTINGLQDTVVLAAASKYCSGAKKFIQIMNISQSHWICACNCIMFRYWSINFTCSFKQTEMSSHLLTAINCPSFMPLIIPEGLLQGTLYQERTCSLCVQATMEKVWVHWSNAIHANYGSINFNFAWTLVMISSSTN